MDLNHGRTHSEAYIFERAQSSNAEFVSLLEELLREVWKGVVYVNSIAGASEIDNGKIAELIRQIQILLRSRRLTGNLRREEFVAVATMSWLHLTVLVNSPILLSMSINYSDAKTRLTELGNRVGYPPHPKNDSFFQLALPLSMILIGIEDGAYDTPNGPALLYTPGTPAHANMQTIITHWSMATGRNLKARDVNQMPVSAMAR